MDAALNWLWQGSAVALALWLLLHLLHRARARVRYAVCWAALVLVVALPFLPSFTSPTPDAAAAGWASEALVSVPDVWWTSGTVVMAAWALWALVSAARFALALVALRRARARSLPFPAVLETRLSHWQRVRADGRRPTLVLSESVATAAVLGAGAPVIAVSPALVEALDAEELDRVLVHEWAHVQRRDDVVSLFHLLVRLVAGWHPAVWAIGRRLHVEREIACDEAAVAITGSPKSYAACLVRLAGLRGGDRTALAAPAVFASSGLRARVTRLVSKHRSLAPAWSYGLALAVISSLAFIATGLGSVALVETAALAFPFEALQVQRLPVASLGPALLPNLASPPQPPAASRAPRRRLDAESFAPLQLVNDNSAVNALPPPSPEPQVATQDPGVGEAVPPATTSKADSHPEPAVVAVPPPAARETAPVAATDAARTPWQQAADSGVVLGRKSRDAGVATAGVFTRFARRVAGSF